MTKLSGSSHNHQEELLQLLQDKFPEVFTEGTVDPKKLKVTLGESVNTDNERYGLNWAGKSDCFRHIQEPVTSTLKPCREESVNFDETENLFIEGDNLEVLKVMQKSYYGKVKMIYIDPPYNTGNDSFIYPDKFEESKEDYLERVGEKEDGQLMKDGMFHQNSKENGHYHSNWLSMMYPRLFLARNLMRDDGVIFVSIDDNEVHNLRLIMNEVFGSENFIGKIVWEKKTGASDAKTIAVVTEYVLVFVKDFEKSIGTFAKNKESYDIERYKHKDEYFDERGPFYYDNLDRGGLRYSDSLNFEIKGESGERSFPNGRDKFKNDGWIWKWGKDKVEWGLKNGFIEIKKSIQKKSGFAVYYKNYLKVDNEGSPTDRAAPKKNLILDIKNQSGSQDIKSLFGGRVFDYPKPEKYIKKIIKYINLNDNDLVLDFFAGSGTTAHAVMALNAEDGGNRKCISVQLPEPCDKKSEAFKAGYKTIADIAKERIRRAGKKIQEEKELKEFDAGFKVFKLEESNFKIWRGDIETEEDLKAQLEMFVDNVKQASTQENILYELVLKSGIDLNTAVEKKAVNGQAYFVLGEGELVICLEDTLSRALIDAVLSAKPEKVVVLDKAFQNDDQLKTNTLLQAEDEGVEFKVI